MGALRRVTLAVTACLWLVSASAFAGNLYSEVRHSDDAVDDAFSVLPSATINGRLNRIATLLERPAVRDLPPGSSEALPATFSRDMERAIVSLDELLVDQLGSLDPRQEYVLLRVVDELVFEPNRLLHEDVEWSYCAPGAEDCSTPDVLRALDRLGASLAPAFWDLAVAYGEMSAGEPALPALVIAPPEAYNSQTFGGWVDQLDITFGVIHGEPDIQYD